MPLQKQSVGLNTFFNLDFLAAGKVYTFFVTATSVEGAESDQSETITYSPSLGAAPAIVTAPVSRTVVVGEGFSLTVFATGDAPLSYQWLKDGAAISGATSTTYSVAASQLTHSGSYTVRITNPLGSAISAPAVITVLAPPTITSQPSSQTVNAGTTVTFNVGATGSAPLTYAWFKNGASIAGATSATLTLQNVQSSANGLYTVVVSNGAGSASSVGATLTVVTAPAITVQPQAATVNLGSAINLSVTATGTAPLSYQWLKGGVNLTGATGPTLNIAAAVANDAGNYSVRVSNAAGSVTSANAAVTVVTPPSITTQPVAQTLNAGGTISLSVTATGSLPLSYQWSKDQVNINGATSAAFVKTAAQGSDAGSYRVRVSNSAGEVTSAAVAVTVNTPPSINSFTTQPLNGSVNFGNPFSLTVQAAGTQPMTFVWKKDGTVIPGATTATYSVASAATGDAGVYVVEISNAAGTVTSSPATVTVFLPDAPTITTQPQSATVTVNSPFSLTVQASGTGPLSYQWLKNGSPIAGATSPTYAVTSAQSSDSGSYVVRVSNSGGNTLSAAATVTVGTPPSIAVQPVSISRDAGLTAEFTVQANGSAPLSYQWSFGGVSLAGATSATLSIPQVTSANAGSYQVRVSNSAGTVLSQAATLTVTGAPTISTQPQSQTVPFGSAINLTVQANGAPPLIYQWIKNGSAIPGAAAATFQVSNADQTHSGDYSVQISNGAGQVTSQTATVTVQPPLAPSITQQPASAQREPGASVTFAVQAAGTAPLTYQWLKNDSLIVGATGATFQISSVQPSDAGSYKVRVSNIGGTAVSQAAVLTVGTAPSITSQPVSTNQNAGLPVTFSVTATGSAPLGYRWRKDGIVIPGATASSYSISQVAAGDSGSYSVVVTNFAGTVTSQAAVLTVLIPPAISTQPVSRSADVGTTTTFLVEATGTPPLQYQWRRNGADISGATSSTFQIASVALADGGTYTVRVTGPGGQVLSQGATLTVTGAPAITVSPQSQTLSVGSRLTLTVQATGAAPLNYQWQKGGANIPGATSATFSIAAVQTSDTGSYTAVVSNGAGSATSLAAAVTVLTPPQITTQPQSVTVNEGSTATLTVVATGSAPLSYQWLKFGAAIPDAINPTLTISLADAGDAGSYSVRVSNQIGSVTSVGAQVSVITPPAITTQPIGQTLNAGATLTLNVAASGSQPLSYQWRKDNLDIPGATGAQYVKQSVQASDAGNYSVRVSNPAGTATSTSVVVAIVTPPVITTEPASQSVAFGSALTLTVVATGTAPLTFTWSKDGVTIIGATAATYQVPSAGTGDSGIYVVTVSNAAGSATSKPASVSVTLPDAPTIATQPQSANVTVGSPINLTVQASGAGTLTYQWLKNGSPINGATSATFSIASAQTSDAATYNVRVSNAGGTTLSSGAVVTVGVPPAITQQPVSISALAGTNVQFIVEATGSAPLTYRWIRNGNTIPGSTSPVLSLTDIKAADAGSYEVEISNNVGTIRSVAATLTVTGTPVITSQPVSQNVPYGNSFSLSVAATGAQPLVFRWIKDGAFIPGATSSTYQVASADLTHSGRYSVEISNGAGLVVSQTATINVAQPSPPTIREQPLSATVEPGALVVFSVQATGPATLSYQWLKNQNPIGGATGSSYQITSVQAADAGSYSVRITNIGGSTTSDVAILKVGTAPTIITQPSSQTVETGNPVTLSVQATGTAPLNYRWSKAGVLIPGATSSAYTIASAATADAGSYTVEISNIAGTVTSEPAVVSITIAPKPPVITAQPVSRSVDIGGTTTFFVQATGSGTLTYEWVRDGLTIPGETNATLQIGPIGIADAGTYLARVSNVAGSVVSAPATLTVTGAPVIVSSPQSQTISVSNSLTLSVQVSGVAPFIYRWIKSGSYIPDANAAIFEIPSVQLSDAGSYSVEVSNGAGSALSAAAIIQISEAPVGNPNTNGFAPSITSHPVAQTVEVGRSATFSVEATGTAPLTFAWVHNGAIIPGATNALFTISATEISNAGTYQVEVRNSLGSVVSQPANLSVVGAPTIRAHPQSQSLTVGSPLALSVDAIGAAPLQYRWVKGGAFIVGATNANFLIPAVLLSDAGNYSVEVSNAAGKIDSQIATIVVSATTPGDPSAPVAPTFSRHPESVTVEVGQSASFSVEVAGTAPLSYRWLRNGSVINGANSATLTIDNARASDAGTYVAEVSNVAGTRQSQNATLTVTGAPQIVTQPRSTTVTVGNSLALSVEVTGAAPLTFRWLKGSAFLATQTNANLIIASAQLSDSGAYLVEVRNGAGSVLSQAALVSVITANTNVPSGSTLTPPVVTRDPVSQLVQLGSPATLSIQAVGSLPLAFKWLRNGVYIENATSPILTFDSVGPEHAGTYSVEISNEAGTILSRPATLSLSGAPVVVTHPQSQSVLVGEPFFLAVAASGAPPLSYHWLKNGAVIPNATNAALSILSAQLSDAGSYSVQITNILNQVVSQPALIEVLTAESAATNARPRITGHPISQTVTVGAPAIFSVHAVSATPLTYRWTKDGLQIPGATSASLTIDSVRLADSGTYRVEVSNGAGRVVSEGATLTIGGAPVILSQPQGQTLLVGERLDLSVTYVGVEPLAFRWIRGGAYIAAATNRNFTIPAVQLSDAGSYAVEISNEAGQALSLSAAIRVMSPTSGGSTGGGLAIPLIVEHPQSQSVEVGTETVFLVIATSESPLKFAWIHNGAFVPNATNAIFRLENTQVSDAGTYAVQVSSTNAAIISETAFLEVTGQPQIFDSPESEEVAAGSTLVLRVDAVGAEPLQYRWVKGGSFIPGATNSTYSVPDFKSADTGVYWVEVSNAAGKAISGSALIEIAGAPVIIESPVSQTVSVGNPLTLTVTVDGAEPFRYQWTKGGTIIPGATNSVLLFPSAQSFDAGLYAVTVSNGAGSATSQSAQVTVTGAPVITEQPTGRTVPVGASFSLNVEATGVAPFTYRWIKGGAFISNGTNKVYSVGSAQISDSGSYQVEVSNAAGQVISAAALVQVVSTNGGGTNSSEIIISRHPESQVIDAGGEVVFRVEATGPGPLIYLWSRNGSFITTATNSELRITNLTTANAGSYAVRMETEDRAHSSTSEAATLTVIAAPQITSHPQNTSVPIGGHLQLSVQARGLQPLRYAWVKNGAFIPSATNSTYVVPAVALSDGGAYWVEVFNGINPLARSRTAQVTITGAPIIRTQPQAQVVPLGAPFTLSVEADGTAPLTYRWSKGGALIPNATNQTYSVAAAQNADSGSYTVQVSNGAGSAVSTAAQVSVTSLPVILQQPISQTVAVGAPISLSVEVGGAAPFTYRWMKGGVVIANATNKVFSIASAALADSGTYSVEVKNGLGTTNSQPATLTVTNGATTGDFSLAIQPSLAGFAEITITAPPGEYTIETTETLTPANWVTLTTTNVSSAALKLSIPTGSGATRFYRLSAAAGPVTGATLKIETSNLATGEATVTISGVPGTYQVQRSQDIEAINWQTLTTTNVTASGPTVVPITIGGGPRNFYRTVRTEN